MMKILTEMKNRFFFFLICFGCYFLLLRSTNSPSYLYLHAQFKIWLTSYILSHFISTIGFSRYKLKIGLLSRLLNYQNR